MSPKTIALTVTTLFLILILYLLGLRIKVSVGEIQNIQEEEEKQNLNISVSPSSSIVDNAVITPAPSYFRNLRQQNLKNDGYLGPYGYISRNNVARKEDFPHHNPLMYQKKQKDLLNNIPE